MAIKLLESSNENDPVLQNIDDGALINFQAGCKADGILCGCGLSNTTTIIRMAPGTLMVRGYRLKVTEGDSVNQTIYTLSNSSYPATATTYYLWLRLTRTGSDCEYVFFVSTSSIQANKDPIEQQDGVYDYKVASFTLGPSGISGNVKSLMANIPTPGSGSSYGSTGISLALPKPILEIIQRPKNSTDLANILCGKGYGFLCIKNKNDYSVFNTNGNTVKFVLYRYLSKGRYRNKRNGAKLYISKTGYVKPVKSLGYRGTSSNIRLNISYSSLASAVIKSSGQYNYKRTDILEDIKVLIDETFYYLDDGVKTPITAQTTLANIKASRSRKSGIRYGRKGLYLKIAFKAELWNGGKKITESDLSNPLIISLNYHKPSTSNNWGDWFIVRLDER